MNTENQSTINCWAVVELFGHKKVVGRVSEESIAGTAMLRVDVPALGDQKAFTEYYGGAAIYGIHPVEEAIALAMLKNYRPVPVSPYELPKLADKLVETEPEDPDEDFDQTMTDNERAQILLNR